MNLEPCQVKDKDGNIVDSQEAVCDDCGGNSFSIVLIKEHNHLICSNPVCQRSYCQNGACE